MKNKVISDKPDEFSRNREKTTILERTIEALGDSVRMGHRRDLFTDQDAQRIEKKGVQVVQINTEGACHLDAAWLAML